MTDQRDDIYAAPLSQPGLFTFDDNVARVFPDMIKRSVPGYTTIIAMTGLLAARYAQAGSRLYDLGCSLGAVTLAMRAAVRAEGVEIVAVDNSSDMIAGLERALSENPAPERAPVETRLADVLDTDIENASVAVLNFTLQFVAVDRRGGLLEKIADGLRPGGILILSEKIRFGDGHEQALQTEWHHDFKRAQGYSDLEIARKRDALECVMVPERLERHGRATRSSILRRSKKSTDSVTNTPAMRPMMSEDMGETLAEGIRLLGETSCLDACLGAPTSRFLAGALGRGDAFAQLRRLGLELASRLLRRLAARARLGRLPLVAGERLLDERHDVPTVQPRLLGLRVDGHDLARAVTDQVDDRVRHLPLAPILVDLAEPHRLEALLELSAKHEAEGLGDAPWPPHYPKMPGEPPRVQPSKKRAENWDEK